MNELSHNVLQLFFDRERELGPLPCLGYKSRGNWKTCSWSETKNSALRIALFLQENEIEKGDRVAILSNTRYEWTLVDLGILMVEGVTVPIYQSSLANEVEYILEHSGAKIVFVENLSQFKKVQQIKDRLPDLQKIVLIEKPKVDTELSGKNTILLKDILARRDLSRGEAEKIEREASSIDLKTLMTIVYTSGTTGQPKGVMLNHENFASAVDGLADIFNFKSSDESLFFLPLAHILARQVQFLQLTTGFIHYYAEGIDQLIDNVREVRPHFMVCVPRIFEKIYGKILNDVEHSGLLKKVIFQWALSVGKDVSRCRLEKSSPSLLTSLQYPLMKQLVFSKLHQKLGGRIRFFISGGAPLSEDIAQFFHAAGMLILEGYGLTETVAGININSLDSYKFGTVGAPLKRVEEKIASDGEILVRGNQVFHGYYRDPSVTQEAFTEDGFFKTGDIGEIDSDGFLKITDRKKDLIVTAGGKNIAPQYVENLLKTDPLISQVMVHGDRRKFLSALITLNTEQVEKLAHQHQIPFDSYEDLIKTQKIHQIVQKRIEDKNKQLPSYETVKKFAILSKEFTVEGGELTPSLKVKRKWVTQQYKDILDSFYQE